MRREYFGILLTLGALLACKRVAKEILKEDAPAEQKAAAAPATPAVATTVAAASAAPAAVDSAAPTATVAAAFDGKYPLDGIRQIPSNCKSPHVILTSVTEKVFDSDKFSWNFAKQVFLANPQFKLSPPDELSKGDAAVQLRGAVHKPTQGVALVAGCNLADTCMQVAAAYKIVVPTSSPEVICGPMPTLGQFIPLVVVGPGESAKEAVKDNVIQQCVRLAACEAHQKGKLVGDPAIECQRRPSSFQLRCSQKASCEDVLSCVEKAATAKAP